MKSILQRWWRFFLIPAVGVLMASAPATGQSTVADLISADSPLNLLSDGGFENATPSYWEPSGDGAAWSAAQSRTPEYSLSLSGSGEASWTMDEIVRNWTPGVPGAGNPELIVGGWVYTEGVNTAPGSDEEKFQLVFEFFADESRTENVLGEPIVIDVPQDEASSGGWVKVSSASLGSIIFPGEQASLSARVTVRKGASATGTVYVDDIFMVKADPNADGWPGTIFNSNVDISSKWYYWWNGFDAIQGDGWPGDQPHFVTTTSSEAYEGDYSLRIESNGENQDETIGISERVPTDGPMLVAFRVKHEGNAEEDSIGTGNNNLGIRMLGFDATTGYNVVGELQVPLNGEFNGLPAEGLVPLLAHGQTSKVEGADWTQYAFIWYPRAEASNMEIRLSYWHQFTGASYWDDVFIAPVGEVTTATAVEEDRVDGSVPGSFRLHQNYPNPFNPATTIAFDLKKQAEVSLSVYNVMGQKVANLLSNQILAAGTQRVEFRASDLPSGTYLYVLEVDDTAVAHKMVLLK